MKIPGRLPAAFGPLFERPLSTGALAVLTVAIGVLLLIGWPPGSPERNDVPGHRWLLAALSFGLAAFFAGCAGIGLGGRFRAGKGGNRTRP